MFDKGGVLDGGDHPGGGGVALSQVAVDGGEVGERPSREADLSHGEAIIAEQGTVG